jgi:uncharacterized membrane protein YkoI
LFKYIILTLALSCASVPASALTVTSKFKVAAAVSGSSIAKVASKKLISSSRAARIAQNIAPTDKLLGVRLSRGGSPLYVIKTRGNGRVREIVIDAQTGAVVKR